MTLDKLLDVLKNLGMECVEYNEIYTVYYNKLEYLKFGQKMLIWKPFLRLSNYNGINWFNAGLEFFNQVCITFKNHQNPLMLEDKDLDGYKLITKNDDVYIVNLIAKSTFDEEIDDIARFTKFILPKIDDYLSKVKSAKFKYKVMNKGKEKEEIEEDDLPFDETKYKRLHNDFIDSVINLDEDFTNLVEKSLNEIMDL